MKKFFVAFILLAALLTLPTGMVLAGSGSAYPWNSHAAPYAFLFGNHIDTHQQSQAVKGGPLQGYLYIHNTGQTINGVPVAEHIDCSTDPTGCKVGWSLYGVPAQAKVVSFDAMGMPQFCMSASTLRQLTGYSHFHWLGNPYMETDLQVGASYSGYLLKLTAVNTFYFQHMSGMDPLLITPGIDTTSHANVTPCS